MNTHLELLHFIIELKIIEEQTISGINGKSAKSFDRCQVRTAGRPAQQPCCYETWKMMFVGAV